MEICEGKSFGKSKIVIRFRGYSAENSGLGTYKRFPARYLFKKSNYDGLEQRLLFKDLQ